MILLNLGMLHRAPRVCPRHSLVCSAGWGTWSEHARTTNTATTTKKTEEKNPKTIITIWTWRVFLSSSLSVDSALCASVRFIWQRHDTVQQLYIDAMCFRSVVSTSSKWCCAIDCMASGSFSPSTSMFPISRVHAAPAFAFNRSILLSLSLSLLLLLLFPSRENVLKTNSLCFIRSVMLNWARWVRWRTPDAFFRIFHSH